MSANTVYIKNIAQSTTDEEIKDFFSFCGKIADIKIESEGETKSATVTFEKETASKTALLLNNTQLGTSHITVVSATGSEDDDGSHFQDHSAAGANRGDSDEITQEEKPRTRILAEYLAHGYNISEAGLNRALSLDEKHGISKRFLETLQSFDARLHATDRARATDQSYGITQKASSLLSGLGSYFEKATNTPTGNRIVKFYSDGSRQVQDIHNEAKRLAEIKKQEHGGSAYKAAGLERVFGKEKPAAEGGAAAGGAAGTGATDAPSFNTPAAESAQKPTAPSGAPGNETATQIPKFDPPPTSSS